MIHIEVQGGPYDLETLYGFLLFPPHSLPPTTGPTPTATGESERPSQGRCSKQSSEVKKQNKRACLQKNIDRYVETIFANISFVYSFRFTLRFTSPRSFLISQPWRQICLSCGSTPQIEKNFPISTCKAGRQGRVWLGEACMRRRHGIKTASLAQALSLVGSTHVLLGSFTSKQPCSRMRARVTAHPSHSMLNPSTSMLGPLNGKRSNS